MSVKVYYLDDELELCENFFEQFSTEEVEVTAFSNPSLAIEIANSSPPDVFFIDFRLPKINGEEVARAIPREIPKYLITGDIHLPNNDLFVQLINKPFQIKEIQSIIDSFK